MDAEDENAENEEQTGEGDAEGTNTFIKKWFGLNLIDRVSETTRMNWDQVFEMNIVACLNVLSYQVDKSNYEASRTKKIFPNKGI